MPEAIIVPLALPNACAWIVATGIAGLCRDDLTDGARLAEAVLAAIDHADRSAIAAQLYESELRIDLARNLHDSIAQLLTGTALKLAAIRQRLGPDDPSAKDLATLIEELKVERREVRGLIHDLRQLRPGDRPKNPQPELEMLCERLSRQWDTCCVLRRCEVNGPWSWRARYELSQIIREAVSNAVRHGGAMNISIALFPREDGHRIDIVDDGQGFAGTSRPWSLSSRVDALGGTLDMCRGASGGCEITIFLPRKKS